MAVNDLTKKKYTLEHIQNAGYDHDFQEPTVEILGYDGKNLQRFNADNLAVKITKSGTDTYVAQSAPGTAYATAKWQVMKIDSSGNVTWANGTSEFENIATDLTSLTYS